MFCFDKAYSLKCLASDKQGSFCWSSLRLTWECSLVSMNTHLRLHSHPHPDGPRPHYSLSSIYHTVKIRLGTQGPQDAMFVREFVPPCCPKSARGSPPLSG